jgi:hypothetical protein
MFCDSHIGIDDQFSGAEAGRARHASRQQGHAAAAAAVGAVGCRVNQKSRVKDQPAEVVEPPITDPGESRADDFRYDFPGHVGSIASVSHRIKA